MPVQGCALPLPFRRKMPIGRLVHRWYDNVEMCFKPKGVDRFHVAEDRVSGN